MTPSDNYFTISPHTCNLALLWSTLLHSYPVPLIDKLWTAVEPLNDSFPWKVFDITFMIVATVRLDSHAWAVTLPWQRGDPHALDVCLGARERWSHYRWLVNVSVESLHKKWHDSQTFCRDQVQCIYIPGGPQKRNSQFFRTLLKSTVILFHLAG